VFVSTSKLQIVRINAHRAHEIHTQSKYCVVVLVWVYYSALLLMGAEFTHVYAALWLAAQRARSSAGREQTCGYRACARRLIPQECAARADLIGGFRKPTEKSKGGESWDSVTSLLEFRTALVARTSLVAAVACRRSFSRCSGCLPTKRSKAAAVRRPRRRTKEPRAVGQRARRAAVLAIFSAACSAADRAADRRAGRHRPP
jgi:hypothetical protein